MLADKNNNSSSLVDRHFLSEPRPVPGLDLPTWDVDVLREGVEQPILTLRVDCKVLPPRKKKKKTIWKLPDSVEVLPKFGEQDRKRILELFREKKKELKKLKNKQRAYRRASEMEAKSGGGGGKSIGNQNTDAPNPANGEAPASLPPEKENGGSNPAKVGKDFRDDASLSPPVIKQLSISGNHSTNSIKSPPPGIPSSSPLKPAPPGLPPKLPQNGQEPHHSSHSTGFSSSPQAPPGLPQNGTHHSAQNTQQSSPVSPPPPPGLLNGLSNDHSNNYLKSNVAQHPPPPPRAMGPCFVLPPDAPPGASMGKFVTETYYLLLRNGLIRDLDAYYYQSSSEIGAESTVHKAVTVGGAHAVCTTPQDRLLQLNTFAGCEMRIKGVQQQPTVGNGMLVLITGVNIRSSPPNGQQQMPSQHLPFCHTLILTPVSTTTATNTTTASAATSPTIGYQILNDNLVILTGDE